MSTEVNSDVMRLYAFLLGTGSVVDDLQEFADRIQIRSLRGVISGKHVIDLPKGRIEILSTATGLSLSIAGVPKGGIYGYASNLSRTSKLIIQGRDALPLLPTLYLLFAEGYANRNWRGPARIRWNGYDLGIEHFAKSFNQVTQGNPLRMELQVVTPLKHDVYICIAYDDDGYRVTVEGRPCPQLDALLEIASEA